MRPWVQGLASALALSCSSGTSTEHAAPPPTAASAPGTSPTMTSSTSTFVDLVLTLPTGLTLQADTREEVSSLIPGSPAVEHFRSYQDASGQGLYFFAWEGAPTRDRGPMKAVETWKVQVGSADATVSRTSHFFGHEREVLVAHVEGPPPARRRYMIYTTRLDRAVFDALLAAIRFSPR
ncbi:hypothetical protein [Sorangium sp. So ce426]|uniref:hypothetical protein n=2 Tax=unclassified Sorangium TaxID=2621164 RepID=UPI003F5B7630